jgi:hypothetical protein
LGSIVAFHSIARRHSANAPEKAPHSSQKKKVECPSYEPPAPPKPPKVDLVETPPPPPKPVEPDPRLELIDGYSAEDAIRKSQLFFLPCKGGLSDGRYAVFPVNPKDAMNVGSMAVIVTGFDSYVHASIDNTLDNKPKAEPPEPKKEAYKKEPASHAPRGDIAYVVTLQDHKRMSIEHFGIYALENVGGNPRLTYEGTIDTLEYRRFFPIPNDSANKPEASDFIDIQTSHEGLRRKRVFPTKCIGGPADGHTYPLLVSPSVLWEKGVTTVAVTDVAFRPKEYTLSFRNEKQPATNLVGHVNLYTLEAVLDRPGRFGRPAGFQLKFDVALDARTYLKLHNGIEKK